MWWKKLSGILSIILVFAFFSMISGCGKSDFEQGKELFDKGLFEQSIQFLEKAKASGDNFVKAENMIQQAKKKMEEEEEANCIRRGESYLSALKQTKTVGSWEDIVQELKSFKCRKLDTKIYVDKAYYNFISYLAQWDAYPQAVKKYCEFKDCEASEPHILIREEEIKLVDEEGKEKEETIQQEIPIAQHDIAMTMFKFLIDKDLKNGRWFDRYAKFLFDNERYEEARAAYEAIAENKKLGFELKSRAKLTAEHLAKGGKKKKPAGENYRFFWIEDVKKKSKLKALKKDLEKAAKEKEQAEEKVKAIKATK